MRLSAPTQLIWWLSLILGLVGFIAKLVPVPLLSGIAFWLVLAGLVILLLACLLKKL